MNKPHPSKLVSKVITGSAWLIAVRLFAKIIDLVTLILFARILNPSDFGLVSIAMASIYIVEAILEMPLIIALVRLPNINSDHLNTVFTISLIRGLFLSIVIVAIAWPYSQIYQDPRLFALMSALSIGPAARGISNPNLVHKVKTINFSVFFATEGAGKIFAAVIAISFAVIAKSYWAIAMYTITAPLISSVLSFVIMPYRPIITLVAWGDISRFLGWNSLSQILSAVNWQLDRLILGRITSHADFGRYSLASDIAALPEQSLVKPIISPLMAGFATANRNHVKLKIAYASSAAAIFAIGFPVMLGLSAMAGTAIKIGLGDKWADSTPMLRWLSLSLALPLVSVPLNALASAMDRPQSIFKRAAIESIIKVPLVCSLVFFYGLWGAIAARVISDTAMSFISMIIAKNLISITLLEQIKYLWRPSIAAIAMYIFLLSADSAISSLTGLALPICTIIALGLGGMIYVISLIILWVSCGRPEGFEYVVISKFDAILKN